MRRRKPRFPDGTQTARPDDPDQVGNYAVVKIHRPRFARRDLPSALSVDWSADSRPESKPILLLSWTVHKYSNMPLLSESYLGM